MSREQLIDYLRDRVGRWRFIWWNGEMIPLGEAIARAVALPDGCEIVVNSDEVVVPRDLERLESPPG